MLDKESCRFRIQRYSNSWEDFHKHETIMWSYGDNPAGKGKENTICHLKMCTLALVFSSSRSLPLAQMIPKVILRNLESWFTARACHLNQASQWKQTKVLTPAWAQREGRAKRRLTVVLFWPWFRWGLLHCFHALSPFSFSSVQREGLRRG